MLVYVLNQNNKPLDPVHPAEARKLLKSKKVYCKTKEPFTIKYIELQPESSKKYTLGIDIGSSTIGLGVIENQTKRSVYQSEVTIRNDIKSRMDRRRQYRRTRRSRKLRHRKPRFLNRGNSTKKGRLTPTIRSKIQAHTREVEKIKKLIPNLRLVFEDVNFDIHKIKNPKVKGKEYQNGEQAGCINVKQFVLARDKYTCKNCKTRKGKLEIHHIIWKKDGGSDRPDNLITLCKDCHKKIHSGELKLKKIRLNNDFKHATEMNIIRSQLKKIYPEATWIFGYLTKFWREKRNMPKAHYIDALMLASAGRVTRILKYVIKKVNVERRRIRATFGVRSQFVKPKSKIKGFRNFDKVKWRGIKLFINGTRTKGDQTKLIDINRKEVKGFLKPITPKVSQVKLINRCKGQLIESKFLSNLKKLEYPLEE